MAKPDLRNALITPQGQIVGDSGLSSSQSSTGCVQNVRTLNATTSGTYSILTNDCVVIVDKDSASNYVEFILPLSSGSVGRVISISSDPEIGPTIKVNVDSSDFKEGRSSSTSIVTWGPSVGVKGTWVSAGPPVGWVKLEKV